MKKIFLTLGILFAVSYVKAADYRGEFHIWKSSVLQTGTYTNTMLSSAPIMFHMITGSPTVNQGSGYFALHQSSGDVFTSDSSTKIFVGLDTTLGNGSGFDVPFDVMVSSHAYYTKTGGSSIMMLWDWIVKPSYTTANDKD
jgi:hypothetical protein